MTNPSSFNAQNLFSFADRVALVTGGGSGIGLIVAQALAANGAKVYICGRTKEKVETAAKAHGQDLSGEIIPIQADISSKEGIQALVDVIQSREKCLCILINNAGIMDSLPPAEGRSADELKGSMFDNEKATFDDWTSVYRTNVASAHLVTSAFLPMLQQSTENHPGWSSSVVNITSVAGVLRRSSNHFSYAASKAAAEHLTRMMSTELAAAKVKVRVNSIAPGLFPSEMTAGSSDDRQKSQLDKGRLEGGIPANRPGKDEDLAQAVLFVAGNQYLNGQSVVVDGGMTIAVGQ